MTSFFASRKAALSLAAVVSLNSLATVRAGDFAVQVVSYEQGSATSYTDPSAAIGAPAPVTGLSSGFPNVLSPFSPAYDPGQIVVVGQGGELTLKLAKAATVGSGHELGVVSNVGLIDTDYPAGSAGSPASNFGGGSAEVRVSADGKTFVSLGTVDFDLPADYYTNAGPYDAVAPASPEPADFGKPFTGSLSSFSGESFSQVISTLNGSGGGTWLNLAGSGLKQVDYVQFLVPTDVNNPANKLVIDSVSVSNAAVSSSGPTSVPLPAAVFMAVGAVPMMIRLRSRR